MLTQILGLHHVTSIASDARANDAFYTRTLGLRRVKKTVNFDAPEVYHLYFGDRTGTPGTVMTSFPFPNAAPRRPGTGETGEVVFAIPPGTADHWAERLGMDNAQIGAAFGETRVTFTGPDGESLALVEAEDARVPWTAAVAEGHALRGFHSVALHLAETGPTADLLRLMGYEQTGRDGAAIRMTVQGGPANHIDLHAMPDTPKAREGAGSVHHIAFAVENRARQLEVREALVEAGMRVTQVIDRDYFWSIYFRTPGGVLFEVATNDPGFTRDEDVAHLGEALKLPAQHAHLRETLEKKLAPLD